MIASSVVKGRTLTYVTMRDIDNVDRADIIAAAYVAAGETPDRCFGDSVRFVPDGSAVVSLYLD